MLLNGLLGGCSPFVSSSLQVLLNGLLGLLGGCSPFGSSSLQVLLNGLLGCCSPFGSSSLQVLLNGLPGDWVSRGQRQFSMAPWPSSLSVLHLRLRDEGSVFQVTRGVPLGGPHFDWVATLSYVKYLVLHLRLRDEGQSATTAEGETPLPKQHQREGETERKRDRERKGEGEREYATQPTG